MIRGRASRLMLASAVLAGLAFYASTFVVLYGRLFRFDDPLRMTDVARLTHARVTRIVNVAGVSDIRAAIRDAARNGLEISIAGARHSQGGHTYSDGAVVLNMSGFDKILSIDRDAMTVTVESGATWDVLQRALAPEGLALKVMQSSNVFTVGGSLSANAHGRDIDLTQMLEVVERFRLMLADGSIVEVSRDSMPDLFTLVIGGYGLYGVILDVTLDVTQDEVYEQRAAVMDYAQFQDYFGERIRHDKEIALMIARPSIDPEPASFLREIIVVTWRRTVRSEPGIFGLVDERHVLRDRFFFGLSRRFDWAKSLRWRLQKQLEPTLADSMLISRNNAMRPPTAPLEFLDYYSSRNSDIL